MEEQGLAAHAVGGGPEVALGVLGDLFEGVARVEQRVVHRVVQGYAEQAGGTVGDVDDPLVFPALRALPRQLARRPHVRLGVVRDGQDVCAQLHVAAEVVQEPGGAGQLADPPGDAQARAAPPVLLVVGHLAGLAGVLGGSWRRKRSVAVISGPPRRSNRSGRAG
ncbi:hypothetical protein C1J01_44780 [Nonomuraea aridisoli]|uniref:Uncharacterized protein n=1 Tax=Nonomuraea aridisoli TaxID=2070368 RepID=A0A2W2D292_9ACTN|nr:hypothetical protein C1J01_44780 [Nonomuraea aridisoli]